MNFQKSPYPLENVDILAKKDLRHLHFFCVLDNQKTYDISTVCHEKSLGLNQRTNNTANLKYTIKLTSFVKLRKNTI